MVTDGSYLRRLSLGAVDIVRCQDPTCKAACFFTGEYSAAVYLKAKKCANRWVMRVLKRPLLEYQSDEYKERFHRGYDLYLLRGKVLGAKYINRWLGRVAERRRRTRALAQAGGLAGWATAQRVAQEGAEALAAGRDRSVLLPPFFGALWTRPGTPGKARAGKVRLHEAGPKSWPELVLSDYAKAHLHVAMLQRAIGMSGGDAEGAVLARLRSVVNPSLASNARGRSLVSRPSQLKLRQALLKSGTSRTKRRASSEAGGPVKHGSSPSGCVGSGGAGGVRGGTGVTFATDMAVAEEGKGGTWAVKPGQIAPDVMATEASAAGVAVGGGSKSQSLSMHAFFAAPFLSSLSVRSGDAASEKVVSPGVGGDASPGAGVGEGAEEEAQEPDAHLRV